MDVTKEASLAEGRERARQPRSLWSTIIVTALLSAIGGFLWIGRGRLALAVFSLLVLAMTLLLFNLDVIGPRFADLVVDTTATAIVRIAWIGLSLAFVLPLRKGSRPGQWYSNVVAVGVLGLAASLAAPAIPRTFLVQSFSPGSSSMEPTLLRGDWLQVSKSAYGYGPYSAPIPLPLTGRIWAAGPERGDIVVFRRASNDYIMRVVGLPGETIRMAGGVLHIDGAPVSLVDQPRVAFADQKQRETLPNGASYLVQNLVNGSSGDDTSNFVVPADHYFVLSDNRDNADDSRFTTGFVPVAAIIGKATRIYWNARGLPVDDRRWLEPQRRSTAP